jgi:hypothetical protein
MYWLKINFGTFSDSIQKHWMTFLLQSSSQSTARSSTYISKWVVSITNVVFSYWNWLQSTFVVYFQVKIDYELWRCSHEAHEQLRSHSLWKRRLDDAVKKLKIIKILHKCFPLILKAVEAEKLNVTMLMHVLYKKYNDAITVYGCTIIFMLPSQVAFIP